MDTSFLYMIGNDTKGKWDKITRKIKSVGIMVQPSRPVLPTFCPFALDNGVFANFCKGREWNTESESAWFRLLDTASEFTEEREPVFVTLPDVVGNWVATQNLSRRYANDVTARGFDAALVLQDGATWEDAHKTAIECGAVWVFLGGSTEWKEASIHPATTFFHERLIRVHVGRVNTARRLRMCISAGADSADGTCLNRFVDANTQLLANVINQTALRI